MGNHNDPTLAAVVDSVTWIYGVYHCMPSPVLVSGMAWFQCHRVYHASTQHMPHLQCFQGVEENWRKLEGPHAYNDCRCSEWVSLWPYPSSFHYCDSLLETFISSKKAHLPKLSGWSQGMGDNPIPRSIYQGHGTPGGINWWGGSRVAFDKFPADEPFPRPDRQWQADSGRQAVVRVAGSGVTAVVCPPPHHHLQASNYCLGIL